MKGIDGQIAAQFESNVNLGEFALRMLAIVARVTIHRVEEISFWSDHRSRSFHANHWPFVACRIFGAVPGFGTNDLLHGWRHHLGGL
jgi:hypothetical protein